MTIIISIIVVVVAIIIIIAVIVAAGRPLGSLYRSHHRCYYRYHCCQGITPFIAFIRCLVLALALCNSIGTALSHNSP